jgi:Family of unknown function (DUF6941)
MTDTQTGQRVPSDGWQDGRGNATIPDVQVPLLLLADYVNATAENKLNIMGVFTSINASSLPYTLPQMVLIAQFRADRTEYGDFSLKMEIRGEDGQRVFGAEGKINIPDGKFEEKNFAQVFTLNNILFEEAGEYSVNAFVNNELKGKMSLTVVKVTEGDNK